jgi:hypothetical protein
LLFVSFSLFNLKFDQMKFLHSIESTIDNIKKQWNKKYFDNIWMVCVWKEVIPILMCVIIKLMIIKIVNLPSKSVSGATNHFLFYYHHSWKIISVLFHYYCFLSFVKWFCVRGSVSERKINFTPGWIHSNNEWMNEWKIMITQHRHGTCKYCDELEDNGLNLSTGVSFSTKICYKMLPILIVSIENQSFKN